MHVPTVLVLFLLYQFQASKEKWFSKKIKAHFPQHPAALQQLLSPHLFNFIQKFFSPIPIQKREQRLEIIKEVE